MKYLTSRMRAVLSARSATSDLTEVPTLIVQHGSIHHPGKQVAVHFDFSEEVMQFEKPVLGLPLSDRRHSLAPLL